MLTRQELEKGMSMLKIIWTALTMSLLLYVCAIPLYLRGTTIDFPPEAYPDFRMMMYGVAFATLIASLLVRRWLLAVRSAAKPAKSGQHPALQRYTTAMIVALAMTEAIGIYGLILFLLGKNLTDLVLLSAFSAAAMTLYFPRKDEIISLADKFDRSA